MANQGTFDVDDACRRRGVRWTASIYGLPWPCWGTAKMKHPGTPILYDTSRPVAEGRAQLPGTFRRQGPSDKWGGGNLLAEGSVPRRARRSRRAIRSSRWRILKKLGWDKDLTD